MFDLATVELANGSWPSKSSKSLNNAGGGTGNNTNHCKFHLIYSSSSIRPSPYFYFPHRNQLATEPHIKSQLTSQVDGDNWNMKHMQEDNHMIAAARLPSECPVRYFDCFCLKFCASISRRYILLANICLIHANFWVTACCR